MRPAILLLCLTVACREAAVEEQDDAPDAAAAAGIVPAIGLAPTVDVICWNVRQFPSTATTARDLAELLVSLDVDVAPLMEIRDDAAYLELLDRLPGWQGFLGKGDGYIKLALLWRPSQVTVTGATTIFEGDYDFPRPPIVATVARGAASMTLVAVHLKAGRATEDAARRRRANGKLAGWLADRGNGAALVCGDFNEDQDNGYAPDVYGAWLAAPDSYRMLTAALDHGGAFTYLPGRIMFDQMISTAALDARLGAETPFIPPLDRQIGAYLTDISDHLPVAVRIDLH